MKYLIRFCNGYCGCDVEEEFEGTYEEAEDFANDSFNDYAASYDYVAFGWDNEYTEEEYEEYFEGCYYEIEEVKEEEEEE